MSKLKYRPYLTEDELEVLINYLKVQSNQPKTILGLIKYFETFIRKIEANINTPSYIPVQSLRQKLDLETEIKRNPLELRKDAYKKWLRSPTSCSIEDLEHAKTYRFDNNLMTEKEIEEAVQEEMKKFN